MITIETEVKWGPIGQEVYESKICTTCRIDKALDEFHRSKDGKKGRKAVCKSCASAVSKEYYVQTADSQRERSRNWHHANRDKARERQLLRKFGLTTAQYDELLESQGGSCKICKGTNSDDRAMPVDHDRACCPDDKSCGKCIRGILCTDCNRALGCVKDNLETIKAMEAYLLVNIQERSDISGE